MNIKKKKEKNYTAFLGLLIGLSGQKRFWFFIMYHSSLDISAQSLVSL